MTARQPQSPRKRRSSHTAQTPPPKKTKLVDDPIQEHIAQEVPKLRHQVQRLVREMHDLADTYAALPLAKRRDVRAGNLTYKYLAAALFQHGSEETKFLALNEDCPEDRQWYADVFKAIDFYDLNGGIYTEEQLRTYRALVRSAEYWIQRATELLKLFITVPEQKKFDKLPEAVVILGWNKFCQAVEFYEGDIGKAATPARNLVASLMEIGGSFVGVEKTGGRKYFDVDVVQRLPEVPKPARGGCAVM